MRVLQDTCTLSELRTADGTAAVKAAVRMLPDEDLFLSVLTAGEITRGIALLGAIRKKAGLASWLAALESRFTDRILGLDVGTGRIWGELTARAQMKGVIIPAADGLFAATALRHGLHVMTRNTRHFEASGALVIDPWRAGC